MKKVIMFLMVAFFATTIFTSCEKDDPMLLSEFVIGEWQSQEVSMDEVTVWYTVDVLESGMYNLSLTDGEVSLDLDPAQYTIDDDENLISIEEPVFPGNDPPDVREWITFNVVWTEDSNVMTWNPTGVDNDAPILIWTRIED